MKLAKTLFTALLLTGLSLTAWSQGSGDPLVRHPAGFSTRIPATLRVSQNDSGMVAVDPGQTYMVVVKEHNYSDFESFAADANLEKDGFSLVGDVRNLGGGNRHFRAAKTTPTGYLIADTFVCFSPYGGGSLIVALSDQNSAETAYHSGYEMATNLQFSPPQASPANSPWAQALGGKHLVYLYTGNGYSERRDLYLLTSGEFAMRNDASSLSANGSGTLGGNSDGRWRVSPSGQLVLQFHQGNTQSYTLGVGQAGNEVLLNGKRYFVINS